ncbi:MAG: hemerythrin domain-containing protein [Bacteroidota bacterium]
MINREMSMCLAVSENMQLLPLFPRFKMKLGFGERSVEEVCRAHEVNTDFFLEIANAYLDDAYIPGEGLALFSLGTVVDYLKGTHGYYVDVALPMVEEKILRLLSQSTLSGREVGLVTGFFNDYKQEFMTHVSEEEQHILPYILELEKQSALEKPDPAFLKKLQNYSIREFEQEHDRLETSLEHLSRLIIKYLPPFEDFQLCRQILHDLSDLVKDLTDHANMEDKILIPRVAELEEQLLDRMNNS